MPVYLKKPSYNAFIGSKRIKAHVITGPGRYLFPYYGVFIILRRVFLLIDCHPSGSCHVIKKALIIKIQDIRRRTHLQCCLEHTL